MAELTIITTRPERALVTLFGQAEPPEGVRVVSSVPAVGQIAHGSRCFAIWYEPRKYRSALEWAWIMRRERGGVVGLGLEELGHLLDHHAFDRTPGLANASRAKGAPAGRPEGADARSGLRPSAVPSVTSMRAVGHEVRA
ncbi:MAG: hypothetical protein ACXIVF_15545 [Rhizobiaceae bacterium]